MVSVSAERVLSISMIRLMLKCKCQTLVIYFMFFLQYVNRTTEPAKIKKQKSRKTKRPKIGLYT